MKVGESVPQVADQALHVFAAPHVTIREMVDMFWGQEFIDNVKPALIPALVQETARHQKVVA